MGAHAYEIGRVAATAADVRAESGGGKGELDSARGFLLALVLSLAGWTLVIALLLRSIF